MTSFWKSTNALARRPKPVGKGGPEDRVRGSRGLRRGRRLDGGMPVCPARAAALRPASIPSLIAASKVVSTRESARTELTGCVSAGDEGCDIVAVARLDSAVRGEVNGWATNRPTCSTRSQPNSSGRPYFSLQHDTSDLVCAAYIARCGSLADDR